MEGKGVMGMGKIMTILIIITITNYNNPVPKLARMDIT